MYFMKLFSEWVVKEQIPALIPILKMPLLYINYCEEILSLTV